MPRNGSGIYSLPTGNPVVEGTVIEAPWANATMSDVGNELTGSLPRNGTAPMAANLPMGSNKITNLADGTAAADAVNKGQMDAALAAKQDADANTALLDAGQTWTAQQVPMNGTLTDGATINWDADTNGQVVSVTLAGNRTLAAPTNVIENAFYLLRVTQDGTGSRTLTWNAAYKFPGGTDPVLSTTANAVDIFSFIGGAGNVLYCVGLVKALT